MRCSPQSGRQKPFRSRPFAALERDSLAGVHGSPRGRVGEFHHLEELLGAIEGDPVHHERGGGEIAQNAPLFINLVEGDRLRGRIVEPAVVRGIVFLHEFANVHRLQNSLTSLSDPGIR